MKTKHWLISLVLGLVLMLIAPSQEMAGQNTVSAWSAPLAPVSRAVLRESDGPDAPLAPAQTWRDCQSLYLAHPDYASGYYTIDPDGEGGNPPLEAYCDLASDGGGWTVIDYQHSATWQNYFRSWQTFDNNRMAMPTSNASYEYWAHWFTLADSTTRFRLSPNCRNASPSLSRAQAYAVTGNFYGCYWYNDNCNMNPSTQTCYRCKDDYNTWLSLGTCSHLAMSAGTSDAIYDPYNHSCSRDWWNRGPSVGTAGKYCVAYKLQSVLPDLEVRSKDIYISTPPNERPHSVWITAWVYNNSTQDIANVKVKFEEKAAPALGGHEIYQETQVIPLIKAKDRAKAYISRTIWDINVRQYVVTVDPDRAIAESNRENNIAQTHTLSGRVTDEDGRPLKYLWIGYSENGGEAPRLPIFTDEDGRFMINLGLDMIHQGASVSVTARLEYHPYPQKTYDPGKAKFKFYDDAAWESRNQTSNKSRGIVKIDRERDWPGQDIVFGWREGGRTYTSIVLGYDYFRQHALTRYEPPNLKIEFMDDDYKNETSWQSGNEIHMWHQDTEFRSATIHEYAHRVSEGWGLYYTTDRHKHSIDENWANYAANIAQGTAYNDAERGPKGADPKCTSLDRETWDAAFGTDWQLAGVWWDLDRDQHPDPEQRICLPPTGPVIRDLVIETLRRRRPPTAYRFFLAYSDKDDDRGNLYTETQIRQFFINHKIRGAQTWPVWPYTLTHQVAILAASPASLTHIYTDTVSDANGNGRWDALTISVGITVSTPGLYTVWGYLDDPSGNSCPGEHSATYEAGAFSVPLVFSGTCLYQNRLTGLYRLQDLSLMQPSAELEYVATAYTLPVAYDADQFEHTLVAPTGAYTDTGQDANGDGYSDALQIIAWLDATQAMTVCASAHLYDPAGEWVAADRSIQYLAAGALPLTFSFPGPDLRALGLDGSYSLRDLSIFRALPGGGCSQASEDRIYQRQPEAVLYTTTAYAHTSFQPLAVTFEDGILAQGQDGDGDGLYNVLALSATINITSPAPVAYTIQGYLFAGPELVASASRSVTATGLQSVTLPFEGTAIRGSRLNGPYDVRLFARDDSRACAGDATCLYGLLGLTGTTPAYVYTQFQLPPEDYVSIAYSDHGTDADGDSLYDYLTVSLDMSAARPMTYTLTGFLSDATGERIASAEVTATPDAATQTVSLNFRGWDIRRAMNPRGGTAYLSGRYTLTLDIDAPANQRLLSLRNVYSTSLYAYTQFDPPPAEFADSYGDQVADMNSDGYYDSLVVTTTLNILEEGTYRIQANLAFTDGAEIDDDVAIQTFVTGTQEAMLVFNGMAIRAEGRNAPYTLRDLEVFNAGGQRLDYCSQAYTTTGIYTATRFQLGGSISGTVTGEGSPVQGARVMVNPIWDDAYSDAAGHYRVTNLSGGTYTVTVYPPDNSRWQEAARNVQVQLGQVTVADFILEPAPWQVYLPLVLRP